MKSLMGVLLVGVTFGSGGRAQTNGQTSSVTFPNNCTYTVSAVPGAPIEENCSLGAPVTTGNSGAGAQTSTASSVPSVTPLNPCDGSMVVGVASLNVTCSGNGQSGGSVQPAI